MFHNLIIQVENIYYQQLQGRSERRILSGISFTVEAGSWMAISGPTGAGKSTLLGILAGLMRPSGGNIVLEGKDISNLSEDCLARMCNEKIGYVMPTFSFIPTMTVLENVEAPLYIYPQRKQPYKIAREMLARIGLLEQADAYPHQLTLIELERIAIARALVREPEILILDEPTRNLNLNEKKQVLDLVNHLRKQVGLTVIMSTQDYATAEYANRQLHLYQGRLLNPIPSLAYSVIPVGELSV